MMTTSLHPMSDFDPRRSAYLYDSLNEHWLRWRPEYAERWREARNEKRGVVNFDGMLFQGWLEIEEADAAGISGRDAVMFNANVWPIR